jgi:hypothetical protein
MWTEVGSSPKTLHCQSTQHYPITSSTCIAKGMVWLWIRFRLDLLDPCWATSWMNDWQGNKITWRKPNPVPLWPPQIPHMTCPSLVPRPVTNCLSYSMLSRQLSLGPQTVPMPQLQQLQNPSCLTAQHFNQRLRTNPPTNSTDPLHWSDTGWRPSHLTKRSPDLSVHNDKECCLHSTKL